MHLPRPRFGSWFGQHNRNILPVVFTQDGPLDLRILGRAVLQAAAVGVGCGLVGALFLGLLERAQHLLLEGLTGYIPLRAQGEAPGAGGTIPAFRPYILVFLPALGGLACGLLTRSMPEARGG